MPKRKPARRSSSAWSEYRVPKRWGDLFTRHLPGYDPVETASAGHVFDAKAADRVVEFFESALVHTKGARAGELLALEPWQKAYLGCLFGWLQPDGLRRYRETLLFVPRKNGKTTLVAGIALYLLLCDGEPGAEIYVGAAEREQARILFSIASEMVQASDALAGVCQVLRGSITAGSGTFRAISADAHTKHGFNAHGIIVDELHAQRDRDLIDVLATSTGARLQPITIYVTTSDFERPGSPCNERHEYAERVRDGILSDAAFLPCLYQASREDDWKSPATWRKANPCLGVSVTEDYLARECRKAVDSPSYENTFKRLHLNIRTEQDERFVRMEAWDACGELEAEPLTGRPCFAGLDLASTTDLSALVLVAPREGSRILDVECRFWVPSEGAALRSRRDRVPYQQWISEGWITATDGDVIDYDVIRADIVEMSKRLELRALGADRWNSQQLLTQLDGDGIHVERFGQGFASMSAPTKDLEKRVIGREIAHGRNPVLRWMAANTAVEMDAAGNVKPSKKKSTERIDGIVSLVMALGMLATAEVRPRSVYSERGILIL